MPDMHAAVFDLFGTLVPSFPRQGYLDSLRDMARVVGAEADTFSRLWRKDTYRDRATGAYTTVAGNVQAICRMLQLDPSAAQLAEATRIREAFTATTLSPRPDAVSTLRRIKGAGLRTALVSACSAEVPRLWKRCPLAPLIDVPVFTCVVGATKPDPRLYAAAVEGVGVPAAMCMYVADGFSGELAGAARAGMRPVLIAPGDESPSDLDATERLTWQGERIETLTACLPLLGIA